MKDLTRSLNTRYPILAAAALLLLLLAAGCSKEPPKVDISVNAASAVIMDAGRGDILFEKNAREKYPPASTVKVMTAIVAVENMPLDAVIKPGKKALRVEPTVAGLRAGVGYELRDLLSAILIKSANDAAVVIAEGVAGSEEKFALLMNQKAAEIGMTDTFFAGATGLPTGRKDKQHTTSRDLAVMMRYARRHDVILEEMSKKEADIYGADGRKIHLRTHNKTLLWHDDAPWGKTGYTREARRTFVGVDPSQRPSVIISLLRSNDLWDDIMTLERKGLELYEIHTRTFFDDLADWVKAQWRNSRRFRREVYPAR